LGQHWVIFCPHWAILGQHWAILGQHWTILGQHWVILGQQWAISIFGSHCQLHIIPQWYLFHNLGDLKDEVAVLQWLLDDNNRELDDAIESVNLKMLEKLLDTSPFMAVFFCKLLTTPF
jgi:hypothetical protein